MNKSEILAAMESMSKDTLMQTLQISYTDVGEDYLCGKMPVNHLTKQPAGLLHGGASAALIETLGSVGSNLFIDQKKQFASGLELNINHLRGMREGFVYGKATIVHKGKTTHVWQVDITNEEKKLVATGRLTMFIGNKEA